MKKLAVLFALAAVLHSCSTDFDVTGDYEETMVVYGLLERSTDKQYIRISRGFISKDRSALEIAQEPDSIYYLNGQLNVYITAQSTGTRYDFAEDQSVPKDTNGVFANSPHLLYVLNDSLNQDEIYNLTIENTVTGKVLTASTSMVKDFRLRQPSDVLALPFTTSLVGAFPNGTPQPIEVSFDAPVNGKVYDVAVRFYYREWDGPVVGLGTLEHVEYMVARGLTSVDASSSGSTPPVITNYTGQQVLSLLGSSLSSNPSITRKPLAAPLEYIYYAGGRELNDLLRSTLGQTGISALEAIPVYSNIEGGYGIFSSRFTKVRPGVEISNATKDSLRCGQYTRNLNFDVGIPTSCN